MIRIVIADDHAMLREGLKRLVESADDMELVGEAVNGIAALDYAQRGGFDLLLLDFSMPGPSGAELVRRIRREAPDLPLLLLTMYEEDTSIERAVRFGANGCLEKEHACDDLLDAIREVATGHTYLPPRTSAQAASGFR
jgi:DNA-binding NarL/FixJ family response regulator